MQSLAPKYRDSIQTLTKCLAKNSVTIKELVESRMHAGQDAQGRPVQLVNSAGLQELLKSFCASKMSEKQFALIAQLLQKLAGPGNTEIPVRQLLRLFALDPAARTQGKACPIEELGQVDEGVLPQVLPLAKQLLETKNSLRERHQDSIFEAYAMFKEQEYALDAMAADDFNKILEAAECQTADSAELAVLLCIDPDDPAILSVGKIEKLIEAAQAVCCQAEPSGGTTRSAII